jgi:hypothetical protein
MSTSHRYGEERCHVCGRSREETRLIRCPYCHTRVCERDAARRGGKQFCSQVCAREFFLGGEEE